MDKWISVNDSVPEFRAYFPHCKESRRVLVAACGTVFIAVRVQFQGNEATWMDCARIEIHGVTHWQDLPTPPEVDDVD